MTVMTNVHQSYDWTWCFLLWGLKKYCVILKICLTLWFACNSLLQDAESKSETSQAISAREHFVFTDTDGQVYHITVEGNTVKDGARIPPDVSVMSLFVLSKHCCVQFFVCKITSQY